MNKETIIAKVKQKLVFDKMEREIFKKLSPDELPNSLKNLQIENRLSPEDLGDFIQNILLNKHQIHKKKPAYKQIILYFAKENRILGLHF